MGTGAYALKEVHDIILERYGIDYSLKQVRIIVNSMGMKCAKPLQHDHRRPDDAEERLKKLPPPPLLDDNIVGFLDETAPQTDANTVRHWSFHRPEVWKNMTRYKSNAFGFYALNGRSAIDFPEHSKKEDVCRFLKKIRGANPRKRIILVVDNFRSHHAGATLALADRLDIELIFFPPYSADLNPI